MVNPTTLDAAALRTATEPRRLQILELIWERERSVGDIAARVPVSTAAVSQHLSKLRAAGLVRARREGRHRFYQATKEDMGALAIILESFWTDRLQTLKRTAETMERTLQSDPPKSRRHPESKGSET